MICIEIIETGERLRIGQEIWVTVNRNGPVRTSQRVKARGVSDGDRIWSLGSLDGYPEAKLITLAEYGECLLDPDPELTDAQALAIMMGGSHETE